MLGSSYKVFKVVSGWSKGNAGGPVPTPEDLVESLLRGCVKSIDVDAGRTSTAGFAVFDDPLNVDFTIENVVFSPLALFTYRVDSIRVPASTVKYALRKRIAENLAATRRERLPRAERDELREQVQHDLLRRTPATIKAVNVAWDYSSECIRFYSPSATLHEDFVHRAREFLGIELRAMDLVGVVEARFNEAELENVFHLLPTIFGNPGTTEDEEG